MSGQALNKNSTRSIWDDVWRKDRYADPRERSRRAAVRFQEFNLTSQLADCRTMLDVGCGTGDLLHLAADRCENLTRLVGVDRSAVAIELATVRNSSSKISYLCHDGTALPFDDNSYDAVSVFGVLEHIKNAPLMLSEIHRVMTASGKLFLTSSNARSALQIKNRFLNSLGCYKYGYQKNWQMQELVPEIEKHFCITRVFVTQADWDMPIIAALDRLFAIFVSNWGRYLCVSALKGEYND